MGLTYSSSSEMMKPLLYRSSPLMGNNSSKEFDSNPFNFRPLKRKRKEEVERITMVISPSTRRVVTWELDVHRVTVDVESGLTSKQAQTGNVKYGLNPLVYIDQTTSLSNIVIFWVSI